MSTKPFFRFSSDESSLHNFFSTVEERFNHYDKLLSQQNEKITMLTAQMKIQTEKNQIFSHIQTETNELSDRIKTIEETVKQNSIDSSKLTADFSLLSQSVDSKLSDILQTMETKIQNNINNHNQNNDFYNQLSQHTKDLIKKSINPINTKVDDFSLKIQNCFDETQKINSHISNINSQINENKKNIQMIKESFLSLNTKSSKQNDMTPLATAACNVNSQFSSLFTSIDEILTVINQLKSRPTEPDLSGITLKTDQNISYDLSNPLLPKLYKFQKISQAVDYIYELVPAIQFYMNALYSKEKSKMEEIEKKDDQKETEKQFSELRYEIADIRSLMTNMATRDDLNIIQRQKSSRGDLNNSIDGGSLNGTNGGFGSSSAVRCIACGRELQSPNSNNYNIKQSLSSSTFPDQYSSSYVSLAVNPPSSPPPSQRRMATTATNGSRKFNVGIVENPRSARSYHTPVCRKIQTPTTNYK